jgi:hypothetical protein
VLWGQEGFNYPARFAVRLAVQYETKMILNREIAPPALLHIEREGDRLVVPRGADFSAYCFRCAGKSVGRPIVKYLRVDKSGLFHKPVGPAATFGALFYLDALEFLLWLIWWVVDWPKSRKRRVVFDLCAEHGRRRRLFRMITILSLPMGVVLVIVGIFGTFPDSMELFAIAPGIALLVTGLIIAACGSDPRLAGESAHFLWVKGAGKPFLERQAVRAT